MFNRSAVRLTKYPGEIPLRTSRLDGTLWDSAVGQDNDLTFELCSSPFTPGKIRSKCYYPPSPTIRTLGLHGLTGKFVPYVSSGVVEAVANSGRSGRELYPLLQRIEWPCTTCYIGGFYDPRSCPHCIRQSLHAPDTLVCMRVPFSNQLCVVLLDLILDPFDRLEVLNGLDVEFSGCVFVHDNQRTRMQLQCG